jgi:hypothetical protein
MSADFIIEGEYREYRFGLHQFEELLGRGTLLRYLFGFNAP